MPRPSLLLCPLFCLGSLLACSAADYARRSDAAVDRILSSAQRTTLDTTRAEVQYPERVPEDAASAPQSSSTSGMVLNTGTPADEVQVLTLQRALEIAIESNRDYRTQLENLYFAALSVVDRQRDFSPIVSATLGYLFADFDGAAANHGLGLNGSVSQLFPWGTSVSIDGATGFDDDNAGPGNFSTGAGIRLTQPLLRGGGRTVTREPLRQAERNLIYAVRDFELFRQDFSIDVARRFYDIVQQKQSIANVRLNLDGFVFAREQAEALFRVGRTTELDVLRAKRNELNARNGLIQAVESYALALDLFEVFLGQSPTIQVDVAAEAPPFIPVDYDVDSGVAVALENRLDLINRRQQLEDARRGVRIARNGLLPDLDLVASYDTSGGPSTSFQEQDFGGDAYTVGLSLGLPANRILERGSYRRAQIAEQREERSLEAFRDNLMVDVRSGFRELARRRQSLEIQTALIADQEKNVRIAKIRFERGLPNRDLIEAEQSLLDARNRLIGEQVNYEIARLQLLRRLGILFIDEQGMWTE